MRAASRYVSRLQRLGFFEETFAVKSQMYGSLALTGEGHSTPKAILMGLEGQLPDTVDPSIITNRVADIRTKKELMLGGTLKVFFDNDLLQLCKEEVLPHHSNGMRFTAIGKLGQILDTYCYYSIGGGFVLTEEEISNPSAQLTGKPDPPFPFHTCEELRFLCKKHSLSIADIQILNEVSYGKTARELSIHLLNIWQVMNTCIEQGLQSSEKFLPGPLHVRRRAPEIFKRLDKLEKAGSQKMRTIDYKPRVNPSPKPIGTEMDWISVFAMAVNEENAAGGRVVTAPTNGAAGVIPGVLRYYLKYANHQDTQSMTEDIVKYLLTAGTIGLLFKKGASISAAEVGCQGEIGVACSMAAAGLCAVYGGTPAQVENAAEIGMEHHLGMTCDPIGGLVQIPCIERNTMGSIKAVNASHLALLDDDGNSIVPLDTVIATMMKTGRDMQTKYKETSLGGLAVHTGQTEC